MTIYSLRYVGSMKGRMFGHAVARLFSPKCWVIARSTSWSLSDAPTSSKCGSTYTNLFQGRFKYLGGFHSAFKLSTLDVLHRNGATTRYVNERLCRRE